jgi:integral membrane sensor domain MASE1
MPPPSKFSPVLVGAAVMSIIAIVPGLNFLNLLCCAGIILGGVAGTLYYNRELKKSGGELQFKDGAAIGVLSGFISALIVVVFTTLLSMVMKQNPIPEVYKIFDQQGFNLPPEAEQFLRKISDEYSKNGFSITLTLVTLITDVIIYPLFGAIGGLLTAAAVGKKRNAEQQ